MTDIMNRKEIWRPVVGYEGLYDVSNLGRVRSLKFGRVKIMKPKDNGNGYLRVSLRKDGKGKKLYVHRIVWEAFVGPIPDGYELDHLNTVRDDNRLENLRCVTRKENMKNPLSQKKCSESAKLKFKNEETAKKYRSAIKNAIGKKVYQIDVETDDIIKMWDCTMDVERELGIPNTTISACCLGVRHHKTAGGYKWKYA